MRYDTLVYFMRLTPGAYDPKTGNYTEDVWTEVPAWASVMDTKAQMMQLIYGGLQQGSLTLHIQNHTEGEFGRVKIGDRVYRIDVTRHFRRRQSFIVSEVQT